MSVINRDKKEELKGIERLKKKFKKEVVPKSRNLVNQLLNKMATAVKNRIEYVDKVRIKYGYSPLNELDSDISIDKVEELFKPWILAGGAPVSMLLDEEVNDYDIFFPIEHLPVLFKYLVAATYAFDFGLLETEYVKYVNLDDIYYALSNSVTFRNLQEENNLITGFIDIPEELIRLRGELNSLLFGEPTGCIASGYNFSVFDITYNSTNFDEVKSLWIKRNVHKNVEYNIVRKNSLKCTDRFGKIVRDSIEPDAYTSLMFLDDIGFKLLTHRAITFNIENKIIQFVFHIQVNQHQSGKNRENNNNPWWDKNVEIENVARRIVSNFDFIHARLWITENEASYTKKNSFRAIATKNLNLNSYGGLRIQNSISTIKRVKKFLGKGWAISNRSYFNIIKHLLNTVSEKHEYFKELGVDLKENIINQYVDDETGNS